MGQQKIWAAEEERVHINQKVLKRKPTAKMLDAFMNILAGGCGPVEINMAPQLPEIGLTGTECQGLEKPAYDGITEHIARSEAQ